MGQRRRSLQSHGEKGLEASAYPYSLKELPLQEEEEEYSGI